MTRWSALLLTLLMLLACGDFLGDEPAADAQAQEDGTAKKKGKKKGKKGGKKGGKKKSKAGAGGAVPDAQVVAAYLADCHHTFPATGEAEQEGDPSNECLSREFAQNCAPDPSGCWVKGQDCIAACAPACSTCQDTCAATCDDCKTRCAEDVACLQGCAQERAACRTTCMGARERCMGEDCSAQEAQCIAEFDQKVAEKCPDCEGIRQCLLEDTSRADRQQVCQQRFPGSASECVSWCEAGL